MPDPESVLVLAGDSDEQEADMGDEKRHLRGRRCGSTALCALAAAALIPTVALGGAGSASTHTVILKEIRFHPATLKIHRGDRVKWVWRDGETEHNVTFQGFHSRTQSGGSYTVRFTHSGSFSYRCTIHVSLGMKGKIIVQ
jgi:plastocyanin